MLTPPLLNVLRFWCISTQKHRVCASIEAIIAAVNSWCLQWWRSLSWIFFWRLVEMLSFWKGNKPFCFAGEPQIIWLIFYLGTVSTTYSSFMKDFQPLVMQTSKCSHMDSIAHFQSSTKAGSLGSTARIDNVSKSMSRCTQRTIIEQKYEQENDFGILKHLNKQIERKKNWTFLHKYNYFELWIPNLIWIERTTYKLKYFGFLHFPSSLFTFISSSFSIWDFPRVPMLGHMLWKQQVASENWLSSSCSVFTGMKAPRRDSHPVGIFFFSSSIQQCVLPYDAIK